MGRNVTLLTALLAFASQEQVVVATTGWDRHELDVAERYRIQGVNGASSVSQLDSNGLPLDPPLINITDHHGYLGPPEYLVTPTHLILRYHSALDPLPDGSSQRCYFAIRIDDATVAGPLDDPEFKQKFRNAADANWKRPRTASDQFDRLLKILALLAILFLIGMFGSLLAVYLTIRRWRREKKTRRTASVEHASLIADP